MDLQVGDRVRVLDETGEGIITGFDGPDLVMVEIDGFDFPFPRHRLVPVLQAEPEDHAADPPQKDVSFRPKRPPKATQIQTKVREVDLHLPKLVDDLRGIRHHEKLKIQLDHCKRAIDDAQRDKLHKLILIHGVGEGILKTEVWKILNGYSRLEYNDASYQRYGQGATEVTFW